MGSRDDDRVFSRDRVSIERVGKGEIAETFIDGRPRLGIVGSDRVADHDQVGNRVENALRRESFEDRDTPALQGRAHRGVEPKVGPGDRDTPGVEKTRERAHARPADGDEVNAMERFAHAVIRPQRHRRRQRGRSGAVRSDCAW